MQCNHWRQKWNRAIWYILNTKEKKRKEKESIFNEAQIPTWVGSECVAIKQEWKVDNNGQKQSEWQRWEMRKSEIQNNNFTWILRNKSRSKNFISIATLSNHKVIYSYLTRGFCFRTLSSCYGWKYSLACLWHVLLLSYWHRRDVGPIRVILGIAFMNAIVKIHIHCFSFY